MGIKKKALISECLVVKWRLTIKSRKSPLDKEQNVNIVDNRHRTLLDIIFKNKRRYLVVPNKLKFIDNRIVIRGNSNVFKSSTYSRDYHFPTKAPILDTAKDTYKLLPM